jgi:hypothetical protein
MLRSMARYLTLCLLAACANSAIERAPPDAGRPSCRGYLDCGPTESCCRGLCVPVLCSEFDSGAADAARSADATIVDAGRPDGGRRDGGTDAGSACVPATETCNLDDDDCDGTIDEGGCEHEVVCNVFNDGYSDIAGPMDAVYAAAAESVCVPGGATGECRRWFGRCEALGAATDGHTHAVSFTVFNDGYSDETMPSDAVYFARSEEACVPGGSAGECRKWFGRGRTDVVNGHYHDVACSVFDDGYTNVAGPSDAIFWNGSMCVPDGASGTCRRWFGRCTTVAVHPG